jgi:type IV secretion system protein VirD4
MHSNERSHIRCLCAISFDGASCTARTQRPLPSFDTFDLLVGLIGAAAVYGIVLYKKKTKKKWRKDMEYGSARWSA